MKKVLLSLIAAALAAALIYSCSKETPMITERFDTATEEPYVSRLILNFIERMETRNDGLPFKSEERISIDSAVWYIDAALNLTYANGNHPFARLHWDTVFVEMEALNSYEAMYQQVFESYDASLNGLAERYHAITGENKQFIMALVEDLGALPGNKRNLRVITVTGTGTLEHSGKFEPWEAYRWHRNDSIDCDLEPAETNAPLLFEALLKSHFDQAPANCRWVYYGPSFDSTYWYHAHPSGLPYPPNYMDYKIFFASSAISSITAETKCMEFDQHGLGLHEMQYYYDNLKDFAINYHNSPQNTGNRRFAVAYIESDEPLGMNYILRHVPQITYKKRILECSAPIIIPDR